MIISVSIPEVKSFPVKHNLKEFGAQNPINTTLIKIERSPIYSSLTRPTMYNNALKIQGLLRMELRELSWFCTATLHLCFVPKLSTYMQEGNPPSQFCLQRVCESPQVRLEATLLRTWSSGVQARQGIGDRNPCWTLNWDSGSPILCSAT
jgi:hypothetical protein